MAKYIWIVVTVPSGYADQLREAVGKVGAGRLGNYEYGSFSTRGIGRGKALQGANPHSGEINQLEEVEEEKVEVFCKEENLNNVISAIKKVHPYDGPVIISYPVEIHE